MRICPKCGMTHDDHVAYCTKDGTALSDLDTPLSESGVGGPRPGTVLGSYRLERLLGIGGMGYVYLAEHTRLGRKVAIKMLRSEYAANVDLVRRFFGEARAVNQIRHENIVQITDFIEEEGGDNYYIMELLEGANLGHLLVDTGAMPAERAVRIALQAADALDAVHAAGIIHRDLKSENIILITVGGRADFVKLLDFGLAKLLGGMERKDTSQTAEGVILGTPEYMAPEQAAGKQVDHRADVYSLGIILYEMITGRKPFTGEDFGQVAVQQLTKKPTRPSKLKDPVIKVPRRLEQLIMDLLEKEPGARPQSMREVHDRLLEIGQGESMALDGYGPVEGGRSRAGLVAAMIGVGVLAAGGFLGYQHFFKSDPRPQPRPDAGVVARPQPPPPPLKPEPPKVAITLESQPPGAEVLDLPAGDRVGLTPVTLKLAKAELDREFEFRLRGHRSIVQKVPVLADGRLVVMLPKAPRVAAPDEGEPDTPPDKPDDKPDEPTKTDLEGTVDPFGDL